MDGETMRRITALNQMVADKYKKKLVRDKDYLVEEKQMMEYLLKHPNVSEDRKREIHKIFETGRYDQLAQELDEEIAQKISDEVGILIERDIRQGRLKPPEKDEWTQRILHKARKK